MNDYMIQRPDGDRLIITEVGPRWIGFNEMRFYEEVIWFSEEEVEELMATLPLEWDWAVPRNIPKPKIFS